MKLHKHSVSGVALIIVLGFLVIISALAVAFFSSVNTELKASRNFAAGITTRQLSDSAVQIVIGQIAAATTRGIDGAGAGNEAWASQPGMIRVYGKSGGGGGGSLASGSADAFYKLYSSDQMILSLAGGNITGFDPMGQNEMDKNWNQSPARWVDLNDPVMVRDPNNAAGVSVPRFPIIDPRAYNQTINPNSANDAHKWDQNDVEGFYYQTDSGVYGVQGPGGDPNNQRLPMPVKWIYVLQDGSLTVPSSGTTTAVFGANPPTQANPIVGRIAFWTDDETCKLNINTAAGFSYNMNDVANAGAYQNSPAMLAGSFWDTPRFYTMFDYGQPNGSGFPKAGVTSGGLALCQLLQNEFQRYPGHPATTSLAPVLKNLLTSTQIYKMVPRYSDKSIKNASGASTLGGTQRIRIDATQNDLDNGQLQPKQDRLYASIDELLYGAHSNSNPNLPGYTRQLNNVYIGSTAVNPDLIDKLRFFLTTQSRAPELNLFGQPRVSAWPIRSEASTGNSGLNAFDNLILFCSTVGQLSNPPANFRPDTATDLTSQGVYRYIFTRRELQIPGDTQLVGTQYELTSTAQSRADCELGRNARLLRDYLPGLLSRPIPGNGVAFANSTKFPSPTINTQAILAEIFDYIRLANSQDTTTTTLSGTAIKFAPRGMVNPSLPSYYSPQAKGFGRMSTLCEATVDFYYAGPKMDGGYAPPSGLAPNSGWSKWDNANQAKRYVAYVNATGGKVVSSGGYMRAFFLFSTFDPMQGYAPKADPVQQDPKLSIEVLFQGDWKASGSASGSLGLPQTTVSTTVYRASAAYWGGRNVGGYEGFMHTLMGNANNSWAPYKVRWAPGTGNVGLLDGKGETLVAAPNGNLFVEPNLAQEYYPFQTPITSAIPIPGPNPQTGTTNYTFNLTTAPIIVKLFYGGSSTGVNRKPLQTINLDFPSNVTLPVPQGPPTFLSLPDAAKPNQAPTTDVASWEAMSSGGEMYNYYFHGHGSFFDDSALGAPPVGRAAKPGSPYTYQTSLQASWSFATRLAWCTTPSSSGGAARGEGGQSYEPFADANGNPQPPGYFTDRWRCIVQPGDTIRSLLYWDGKTPGGSQINGLDRTASGDLRVGALTTNMSPLSFAAHPDYMLPVSRACVLRRADGGFCFPAAGTNTAVAPNNPESSLGNHIYLGTSKMQPSRAMANLPRGGGVNPKAGVNGVNRPDNGGQWPGDFDTGIGDFPDGPFCNKQDEGNVVFAYTDYNNKTIYPVPYFTSTWAYQKPGNTFYSPSRQMPSAAMMGSLPSYAPQGQGWTTLSFSPVPAGRKHPGNTLEPKDHYLLDLFQMPIVEPYPISEPFSTAGKVNLNYRMVPFDYIRRQTALRGALFPLRVTIVPSQYNNGGNTPNYLVYKTGQPGAVDPLTGNPYPISANFRDQLDRDKTMQAIDGFYDQGIGHPDDGFFKSATQICERYLYSLTNYSAPYPGVQNEQSSLQTWWEANGDLTGDNMREKPYVDLYPRITTKSNTYTVHMRVQTLRQSARPASGSYGTWVEGKDSVLGEYRGSVTIERYLDPADPRFNPTYPKSINPDKQSVEPLYRFRSVMSKKFNP